VNSAIHIEARWSVRGGNNATKKPLSPGVSVAWQPNILTGKNLNTQQEAPHSLPALVPKCRHVSVAKAINQEIFPMSQCGFA
jgi:hypothetical protein